MIVVDNPLADVLLDVEEKPDLGTVREEETIVHLTQSYVFLPVPLPLTVGNGIATIPSPVASEHNRKTRHILELLKEKEAAVCS